MTESYGQLCHVREIPRTIEYFGTMLFNSLYTTTIEMQNSIIDVHN
jgi:hypothetical protein